MKLQIMIDSGAYSASTKGVVIDLDEYIGYVHSIIADNPNAEINYVNLDVIGDGKKSYRNWRIMLQAGLNPIPVYHAVTDIIWLKKYLRKTDHIGIGAIASMSSSRRTWALDRIWNEHLVDSQGMPTAKVHGMGITSFPLMRRYPWHSIDSTSWLLMGAYGKVFLPKMKNKKWDFQGKPYVIAFSEDSPSRMEKGKHFSTLPPMVQKALKEYIQYTGHEFGENTGELDEKGKPIVKTEGVLNDHKARCSINAFFFAQFIQGLPYPRKMGVIPPKGLFA